MLAETRSAVGGRPQKQTNKQENNRRMDFIKTLSGRQAHAAGMTNGLRAQISRFDPQLTLHQLQAF